MFKAVNNLKEQKGFTLIELLIVIAIIGILAAIAVPAFLGQREKAKLRSVESSAKGSVAEIQALLDAYVAGDPFIVLNDNAKEICVQADTAGTKKNCQTFYTQPAQGEYNNVDADVGEIVSYAISHHIGKEEKSPYFSSTDLFIANDVTAGSIVLVGNAGRSIDIKAYGETTAAIIFFTTITAR